MTRPDPVPGRVLGTGRRAQVRALGDHVFKSFAPSTPLADIHDEAARQDFARRHGAPAPLVRGVRVLAGHPGIVMDRAPGPVLTDALLGGDPAAAEAALRRMATLHHAIHACPGTGLPRQRDHLAAGIAAAGLPPAARAALLARLAEMPDGASLCHGDFHPFNILGPPGQEAVIDWDNAVCGDPLANSCRTYVLIAAHDQAAADRYLAHYADLAGIEPSRLQRWLPLVAASRLSEGVMAERAMLRRMAGIPAGTPRRHPR